MVSAKQVADSIKVNVVSAHAFVNLVRGDSEGTRAVVRGMKKRCTYETHARCMCDDSVAMELRGGSSRQRGRSVRVRDAAYTRQHNDEVRQAGGRQ